MPAQCQILLFGYIKAVQSGETHKEVHGEVGWGDTKQENNEG